MSTQQDVNSTSLLATKFQVPLLRPDLVPRPHLIERLNLGLSRRVTLVSAPAGFGKTTLLGQWIEQAPCRVAWVSLDEGDDDPASFWMYVIAALQSLEANLGADALEMLRAPRNARAPIESVLISLINDVNATAKSDKIVLILDDYHLIKTESTHETLGFLINRQPRQLHIVLSCRFDPLLPLARLRARDHLSELRAEDLRFDPDEVKQFFVEMMGIGLSTDQIAALGQSSEGWIAGLKLAGLSMLGRSDISDFINNFAGSNRYVLDYLVEEVLRLQPEATQEFLLQTSILDRLTAPLCDALTLGSGGQAMLESLEKANLFITALDDERRWYRYHHLFAEFLRHRLKRNQPGSLPLLQRRVSEWYERNDLLPQAIDFALAADDLERAAGLIESVGRAEVLAGDIPRLLGWLEALPAELVCSRPVLCLTYAWALVLHGETPKAETTLRELERELGNIDAGYILGDIAAIRANIACYHQDASLTLDLAHQALELLPARCKAERGAVLLQMGAVFEMQGNVIEASRAFSEAFVSQGEENNLVSICALSRLVSIQVVRGRLGEAKGSYERAMHFAVAPSGSILPYVSSASLGMGAVSYERDDLEAAESHTKDSIEFGQQWGRPMHVALGRIQMARIAIARGDWNRAGEELQAANELVNESLSEGGPSDLASLIAACRLRWWVCCGKTEAAKRLIQERELRVENDPDHSRESEHVALAWFSIVEAARSLHTTPLLQVVRLLDRMCGRAEASGRMGDVIDMLAIRSLAMYSMGDNIKAMISLQRALALAEPEGYIRTFVDLGEMMANLLKNAPARGVASEHMRTLLAAFERDASRSQKDGTSNGQNCRLSIVAPLAESLSERELEVLRLVADGLSNQQIAGRLILAVGTVKRHINNIFGKLGAGNRLQAVTRARELGLL